MVFSSILVTLFLTVTVLNLGRLGFFLVSVLFYVSLLLPYPDSVLAYSAFAYSVLVYSVFSASPSVDVSFSTFYSEVSASLSDSFSSYFYSFLSSVLVSVASAFSSSG